MKTNHVGEMTVGKLKELLEKYNESFEIVISEPGDNPYAYSLYDEIGEGGLPSGIIELRMKEMVMG